MKQEQYANINLDFDDVLDTLEEILPEIPDRPIIQQFEPPNEKGEFKIDPNSKKDKQDPLYIKFGKYMPKDKNKDGEKKKKKKAKKQARKKDEKPPKPIQWDEARPQPHPVAVDLLREAAVEMRSSVFPQNIRQE